MSLESHFSLIDLSKQFKFNIDDNLKDKITFGETLLISCAHYDGEIGDLNDDSDWSSSESVVSNHITDASEPELNEKEHGEEEQVENEEDKDDDFQFYFFPDCTKPKLPRDSKASIITQNGIPRLNPIRKTDRNCTCNKHKNGECSCFVKVPCHCGAKNKRDCNCGTLKEVCICKNEPMPVCSCRSSDVCLCQPDSLKAVCSCDRIKKPCICDKTKFPLTVCECKKKPKLPPFKDYLDPYYEIEEAIMETETNSGFEEDPCVCQDSTHTVDCICPEGTDCTSKDNECDCAFLQPCKSETLKKHVPTDLSKQSCKSCHGKHEELCTCETNDDGPSCECFPKKVTECNCGDPENCKCFTVCDCENTCICDLTHKDEPECSCPERLLPEVEVCTCLKKGDEDRKLKKVREGKSGYRWCHDVDPKHTYFDYGYGRHEKVAYKEEIRGKIKILGLYDEKEKLEECSIHKVQAPPFIKKIRKPSLDCCSTVGGISFSVETLGEDKDKFLVQVVSHSSKEGAKTGFKLVSILDANLHTMEENRTEYLMNKNFTKERKSYVSICDSGYYNKVTRIYGDRSVVKRIYYEVKDISNFLLEGASVVLLRYFAVTQYRGTVQTESLLMNGKVCQCVYVSMGMTQGVVNGRPMYVVKVERHIIEPSGVLHQTLTILTLRGYIVSHEWADSAYIFHINPILHIIPEKDIIESHEPLRENWRKDMQLLSDYLDFKNERTSENARYMAESGGLTSTVKDYLEALLLLKPQDALHFTRHYFDSALSAMDLPHNEYFDPTVKHVRYFYFED